MATRLDPLEYLERSDKWHLGGGRAAMFAPVFPRFLDSFGFWDEAYFADVRLDRLFTVLVLDEQERPLTLRREARRWTPDALTQTHTTVDGLRLREDKVVTPNDTLASRFTLFNDGKRTRTLQFILWSLQERSPIDECDTRVNAEQTVKSGDYLAFAHTVAYGSMPYADRPAENAGWGERAATIVDHLPHFLQVALGADRSPVSFAVNLTERADTAPLWQTSIVPEKFVDGRLPDEFRPNGMANTEDGDSRGHLHLCLHYTLEVPVGETRSIQFGATLNLDRDMALLHLQNDLQQDVAAASRRSWHAYFDEVPYFECSNPHLQKYYWYRWYGLRLLTVNLTQDASDNPALLNEGGPGRFPHPCVFEGIGGFRCHVSYSAQCHVREAAWKKNTDLARGSLEGILASQENSGYIPGHIYLWRPVRGFYHADWGANAIQLYHMTKDRAFVDRVYPGLSRYADYFERDRDREDSHLYDISDQGETGQEYMSRYIFADAAADDWRRIRLKGVDATVYIYRLQRALAEMAQLLGKEEEEAVWNRKADATRKAVREKMWDPSRQFFYDVDPKTGERSPYKAAVGFYPFLCDIAEEKHLPAITEHLFNRNEFWTNWPVPACSLDDPYFSAVAEWRGKRMSCPWNGRVWPMTNSHVCEALATAALTLDPSLKERAAWLITRFVEMMFFDDDPKRPNCFEHYNPLTGTPSMYRGIDDYQHSWVIDLLMKYLVGLQPNASNTLVFDPLPFQVDRFSITGIQYRGCAVDVLWNMSDGYIVTVDGVEVSRTAVRTRVEIPVD